MMSKSKSQPSSHNRSLKKAVDFFEGVKHEFWKIQWTEKNEVRVYAKVVVLTTFVFGMVLYVIDLLVQRMLYGLEDIFRWVFG